MQIITYIQSFIEKLTGLKVHSNTELKSNLFQCQKQKQKQKSKFYLVKWNQNIHTSR